MTRSFRDKHASVYSRRDECAQYARLCSAQDSERSLLTAVERICLLSRSTAVLDLGAGTGKLSELVAPLVGGIIAVDRSVEMLRAARALPSIGLVAADMRLLPVRSSTQDLVLAGWALSSIKAECEEWYADGTSGGRWREELQRALDEVNRVLVPGGILCIFESQGTASEIARRTGSHLYRHLRDLGFSETLLRTDYCFRSRQEALHTLNFFFGRGVASRAAAMLPEHMPSRECTVPECTGMWWRQKRHDEVLE